MAHVLSPIGRDCKAARCSRLSPSNTISSFYMQTVGDAQKPRKLIK